MPFVELIFRKCSLRREQGELVGRNEGQDQSLHGAVRTIAHDRLRKVCFDLIAHRSTMASSSVFHMPSLTFQAYAQVNMAVS